MLGTILVPLDGSESAERALPIARSLAERFTASLVLIRAVLPERLESATSITGSHFESLEQEILIEPDTRVSFVKLIPLVGG